MGMEELDELIGKINELNNAPTEFDYVAEGNVCEQCGSVNEQMYGQDLDTVVPVLFSLMHANTIFFA